MSLARVSIDIAAPSWVLREHGVSSHMRAALGLARSRELSLARLTNWLTLDVDVHRHVDGSSTRTQRFTNDARRGIPSTLSAMLCLFTLGSYEERPAGM